MKNINLLNFMGLGDLETRFSTTPNISNKELLQFYEDTSIILKELDPEIDYEGETYSFRFDNWYNPWISLKYKRITKYLKVITNDPKNTRLHLILYHRDPINFLDKDIKYLEESTFGNLFLTRPNITINSTDSTYSANNLLSRISDLGYVGIPDDFDSYVFNPKDIIDVATGKKYSNMFLSKDGNVFTID